jgi:hypothetical protein
MGNALGLKYGSINVFKIFMNLRQKVRIIKNIMFTI